MNAPSPEVACFQGVLIGEDVRNAYRPSLRVGELLVRNIGACGRTGRRLICERGRSVRQATIDEEIGEGIGTSLSASQGMLVSQVCCTCGGSVRMLSLS